MKPLSTSQMALLKAIAKSKHGLTDQEYSAQSGIEGNTVRPRRRELALLGLIEIRGTRTSASGRRAQVWVATKDGHVAIMKGTK